MQTTTVTKNPTRNRYELYVDGKLVGKAEYEAVGNTLVFPHTEITPPLRGRGLGEQLVREALDDVRRQGHSVVPRCWYVAQFIHDHPDYADLLAG
jgi:predicted GNAT family acetyltransferase